VLLLQGWTNPGRQVAMAPRKFALVPRILEAVIGIKMLFCYFENAGLTITILSGVHLKNLSRNHS
jgi:ABC-type transporter Mla maintaining outer membrane lipid asymmetry permease subunit MlaE